jgi:hypothetical protein
MTDRRAPAPPPVFVDRTGTRRRWISLLGVLGGVVLALAAAVLVTGFLGGGSGYLPGLPDQKSGPDVRDAEGGPAATRPAPTPAPGPVSRAPRPTGSATSDGLVPVRPAGSSATSGTPPKSATASSTVHGNAPSHPSPSRKK